MALRPFEVAADQIVALIEEERTLASEVSRQQLVQAQSQFNAFRNAALETHAGNEAINVQCRQEIERLTRKLQEYQELQYTLHKAGIYHSNGRLAFGGQWGAVVRGFRPSSPNLPQGPFLLPTQVLGTLEERCRAENWRRGKDSAEIARLENLVRWYRDFHETKFPPPLNTNLAPPLVDTKPLKRELEAEVSFKVPEPAAKRSKVQPSDWGTAATPTVFSATTSTSPVSGAATPTFSQLQYNVAKALSCLPPQTTCSVATPLGASPVIDRWNCVLTEPVATERSRKSVLPPLAAFVDAHSCTYYLWFSIRTSLYARVGDPQSSQTAWTSEEWELKLYNNKNGKRNYIFNQKVFDESGSRCACGMPPLRPSISQKMPHRVNGTPIQSADFESPVLQAFICADLELAHAKLQFEQTDDILIDTSWSTQRWSDRVAARATIFRDSWDPSFVPVPLETSDILARRLWIFRFRDLLREWPNFESVPAPEDETHPGYLDSLAIFEQRMIAFYLETVARTLGICPARPRQRPNIDTLPELYRNMLL